MFSPQWDRELGTGSMLVSHRMQGFYNTFTVLAALISGLAVGALTFDEFHPTASSLVRAAEGLLCSAAATAVVSAVLATMLLFHFEGVQTATRLDLVVAWSPLFLLDVSVVEFLVGVVCWYASKNAEWRYALISTHLAVLLGSCIVLSVWMYQKWPTMTRHAQLEKSGVIVTTTSL